MRPALTVRKHGRHFAVYEGDTLLAVCCYRKGAEAVMERILILLRQDRTADDAQSQAIGEATG